MTTRNTYQQRAEARFWAKVNRFGPASAAAPALGPCWLWTAATNNNGYGLFTMRENGRRRLLLAHRWVFELIKEPIPAGMEIDHLCNTRNCVRPDHLVVATHRDNTLRSNSIAAQMARKTHCVRGHEFTPENTYSRNGGRGRRCRKCTQAHARLARSKSRERAA
ncbi:HNH endonuclease signature motif containing protein [Streptomyces werraensis]|uniref:HNH endonuclease signature motif containing protein n=1 Tax=Streptomyces werraensis TaxID=68284 RepID=UPI0036BC1147